MTKRLLVGYRTGDVTRQLAEGDVTCHQLDVYLAHAFEKAFPDFTVVCSPHLPKGEWDEICFRTGPKLMSGELALDLLQEIADLLGGNLRSPRFRLDYVGRERDKNDLLDKLKDYPKRVRSFRSTWPASVPGGETLTFSSYPGCFCHRRMDEGGLALAEVVCRDLLGDGKTPPAEMRLLDMGCGCGLVALLIARRLAGVTVVKPLLIDSHTRAIEAARENAATLGVEAEFALTDNGIAPLKGTNHAFDIFVGNPPYYSDYRIADVFLDTARKALKHGGVAYSVCKNAEGLKPVQERYFPSVEIIPRRGYAVLRSVAP